MNAAVLTVSDGVSAGVREDSSGRPARRAARETRGSRSSGASSPTTPTLIAAAMRELADSGRGVVLTTGGTGLRAARRHARGDALGDRPRGAGSRGGDSRGRDRADAARAALARHRRVCAERRSSSTSRARRAAAATASRCIQPALRHGLELAAGDTTTRAPADVTTGATAPPLRGASRRSCASSTRSSRFRSRTSARSSRSTAWPGARELVWVTVAMVGARTLAMALNRLIDAELDARNPRTATRELPSGALSRAQVARLLRWLSLAVFLVAVFQLDPIVRWLWPIPVALFVVYPYLKRVTWLCHLWLGALPRARAGRRLARDHRDGAVGGVGDRRRRRALGGRLRPLLLALRPRARPRARACTRGPSASASAASSSARAPSTPARSRCSRWPASGSTSRSSTGSASSRRRRCSPTSTRSSGPATCAGSTPRSSRSTA